MTVKQSAASQDALLNLIRVASAFAIAIWHFQLLIPKGNQIPISIEDYPFARVLNVFYTHGFLAVQLFWVISGFVIAKAYTNIEWVPNRFFRNRFARLYPLHFLTLILVTILQTIFGNLQGEFAICKYQDTYHFLLNLLFIPAVGFEKGCSFNAPIWSVSVEITSYLAFACLLTFGGKLTLGKLAFVNIISLTLFIFNPLNIPAQILECSLFFFIGTTLFRMSSTTSQFPIYIFPLIASFIFLKTYQIHIGNTNLKESSIPWIFIFGSILIVQDWVNKRFKMLLKIRKFSEKLGNLTYSSYLLQYPLILCWLIFCSYFKIILQPQHLPYLIVGYIILVFGLSYLCFQKYESYWREKLRN